MWRSALLSAEGNFRQPRAIHRYFCQIKSIIAENKLGTVKPSFPTIVEHSTADDVIPYATGKQLAKDWCAKGANVQFKDIVTFLPFFTHVLGMSTASGTAASWLADRFAGKPTASNCGSL